LKNNKKLTRHETAYLALHSNPYIIGNINLKDFNSSLSKQKRTLADENPINDEIIEIQAPVQWYLTANVLASNESYIVTWYGNGKEYWDGNYVFTQLYSFNEEGKTPELQVFSGNIGLVFSSTALFNDGRFIIAWSYWGFGSELTINATIYNKYGNPLISNLKVYQSEENRTSFGCALSVAVLSNQGFVIVWLKFYNTYQFQMVGQLYDTNYHPLGNTMELRIFDNVVHFQVLSLNNRKFVIIQPREDGIYGTICKSDWSCKETKLINRLFSVPRLHSAISFPNGDFMVVWVLGTVPIIFAQRFSDNGTIILDKINMIVYRVDFSSISIFNEGFVIVWSNSSGVYGQFFMDNGTLLQNQFAIVSSENCSSPSIACTNSEECAITWMYSNSTPPNSQSLYMTYLSILQFTTPQPSPSTSPQDNPPSSPQTPDKDDNDSEEDDLLRFLMAVVVGLAFFVSYGCFLKFCRKAVKPLETQRQQELVSITNNEADFRSYDPIEVTNRINANNNEPNMNDGTKVMKDGEESGEEGALIVSKNIEDAGNLCIICLKNKANMIFVNCKHICCCDKCVESIDINGCCPYCEEPSNFQRVTLY